MDESSFTLLYKSMVRPHLEYAIMCGVRINKVTSKSLKKIQKRSTKLVIDLKKIPYKERLMHLKLPTLKYKRLRGDMIEVFIITHNIYHPEVSPEACLEADFFRPCPCLCLKPFLPWLASASLFLPCSQLALTVSVSARLSLVKVRQVLSAHTRNCICFITAT